MANKIRFIMHNHSDSAEMTATNASTTLPIENVQLVSRSSVFRATAASTTITGTFSSAQSISAVVVGRHNLTQNSTIRITLHDNITGTGTTLGDSGTITVSAEQAYSTMSDVEFPDLKNIAWFNRNGTTLVKNINTNVRSYKIVISGSGMSTMDIGRILAGDYIEPTYNISYGHGLTWEDDTSQYRSDAGSLRSDIGIPYKKFDFDLNTISEADRIILGEAFADVGKRKDFFVSMFPENSSKAKVGDYSGIVKLNKMPKYTAIQCEWLSSKYSMEEV